MKGLRTLKSFKIFKREIKKLKTYSGLCAFKGLSEDVEQMKLMKLCRSYKIDANPFLYFGVYYSSSFEYFNLVKLRNNFYMYFA